MTAELRLSPVVATRAFVLSALLVLCGAPVAAQALGDGQLPDDWFGPGPLHTVLVESGDTRSLSRLELSGAVVFSHDYGIRRLYVVDEASFGGRQALAAAGLPLRDELRLIPANGYLLDTAHPEQTMGQLHPAERIDDVLPGRPNPSAGLYLVQFAGPVADEWLERLDATGSRRVQYLPMNAYVVSADHGSLNALLALRDGDPALSYVGAWQPAFRMRPIVRQAADEALVVSRHLPIRVQLVETEPLRAVIAGLSAMGTVHGARRVGAYTNVDMDIAPDLLRLLARQPSVFAIEPRGVVALLDERQGQISAGNVSGSTASGPGYLSWLAGQGFNSSQFGSFSVNVVDDATSLTGHPDLDNGRIDFTLNPTSQTGTQGGHGFLNAHIVAGFNNGTGSANEDSSGYNYGLGIAPWAHVGSTAIFGSGGLNPTSYESSAYNNGARISTNSWSFQTGGGAPIPDYDTNAQEFDVIVRDARSAQSGNQEYMVIFAAGNDGPGDNTVSTPSTAKNILTVGASENWRPTGTDGCGISNSGADDIRDIISFSSHGPVNSSGGDGRWKPEIVAQGTHVEAGVPQSNYNGSSVCNQYFPSGQTLYGWSSGTSHSTPALAGGAALVRQWFLNQSMAAPSPAMNKAVLVNGAEYMTDAFAGDTLPSNSQGMGRMQLGRSFAGVSRLFVDQSVVLGSTGANHVVNGVVDDSGQVFRVSLVWTDAPGSTSGAPWVNDLDLTVNVGGATYRGNVFSGATSVAGGSADIRNNTESVFLPAGLSGAFTVTVSGSTISGDGVPGNGDGTDQDFALVIYNGSTGGGPTPPIAGFIGTPVSGIVPLAVSFNDTTTGTVDTWAWTFGDGGTSTAQNPSHTYTSVGTYTVSLIASGSAGSDTDTKVAYIDVTAVPPAGVGDGSFESQTAGAVPSSPWSVDFGSGHVISPSGVSSDSGMPSEGTQWAEIAGDSTNNTTPPSNPGGVTNPAVGGAGITQMFSYPAGQSELSFEALFLRNEDPNSTYNDWMSVDISDGSTTINLFYKDTFSATSGTSAKYGFAVTPIETVTSDLAALFPSSTTATQFTLTALVGNSTDNIQPSNGYVDDFRFGGAPVAPVAGFTGTPTSGVLPLGVGFSDASTGSISTWSWAFGDGGTSTAQNPSHTYNAAGTYTVALTVTGPGGSDTHTEVNYITVNEAAPVAGFTGTPTTGVFPLGVGFTDASTGVVSTWAWTFGDGGTSTAQNPSHTYNAAGSYTVALTVTGPGGFDNHTEVNYITVNEAAPVAAFTGTPTSGVLPLGVGFSDASTGVVSTWAWTFGDGGTSTAQNPSHTYNVAGSYTVSLTVTGPGGFDNHTEVSYITVNEAAPVAAFTGTPTSGVLPLGVGFSDASTGVVSTWAWTFGDGGTSTAQNPSHTYNAAGSYTVALTVTGPGGFDNHTEVNYITVNEAAPVAGFTGTPTTGVFPLGVGFTDASTGVVSTWAWTFGDGGTSTAQNPSHTYNVAGSYTVSLTVTGPGGFDNHTEVSYITVNEAAPVAAFTGTPTSGVLPLGVGFTDASTGVVSTWAWTFGDGGTSTAQNPSHTYNAAGTYTVALTVTGPGGADTHTEVNYITVNELAPVAAFTGTPTSGVLPLGVGFSDASTGVVSTWAWTFGDGGTSTAQNPSHTYNAAGTYTVALTVTGPGGADTHTEVNYITVNELAPVAAFTGTPTSGVLPLGVGFSDASTGVISTWAWTFGDGGTSTAQNPSHTYNAAGSYTVALTVTGPGGFDNHTEVNYITVNELAPVASFFGTPTSGVLPLGVGFTDASTGVISTWAWTFGDGGTSTAQNPSHTYNAAGTYTVALTVTGPGGADTHTEVDYVTVTEPAPVASFAASPTSGLAPLMVAFSDTSTGPITAWSWSFGDGGVSTDQNPSYSYATPGTYTVTLMVSGPGGSDTVVATDAIEAYPNAFVDVGNGLAGTNGVPLLVGTGALQGNDPVSLELTGTLENSTATLVVGFTVLNVGFKGGILVPAPDMLILGLPTGPGGTVSLSSTWPAGLPAGLLSAYQYWINDPAAPAGFSASNGVTSVTP